MRKIFKVVVIILMILGITLSVLNFISVDNMAMRSEKEGTHETDGGCTGFPDNC